MGQLQAFIDGEAGPAETRRIAAHLAVCDRCAETLATAEAENALVFEAIGREIDTLVPTQRLWERISSEIETTGRRKSFVSRFYDTITRILPMEGLAAAAAAVFVIFFGMVYLVGDRRNEPGLQVNTAPSRSNGTSEIAARPDATENAAVPPVGTDSSPGGDENIYVAQTNLTASQLRRIAAQPAVRRSESATEANRDAFIPGEESYIRTIRGLEQGIGVQNASMSVSGQVGFERDLAILDASIKRMREVVRRNPRDRAARRILYAAYQDKIDLLNSAAQRQELIASIK